MMFLACAVASLISGVSAAQAKYTDSHASRKVPRYSVINHYSTPVGYVVDIFTGEKNIEEQQLRRLLKHLFKKYSKPKYLRIFIYTHQSQLRDLGKIEVNEPNDEAERHPSAVLERLDGKEEINYKLPGSAWQEIIVKEGNENKKN